MKNKEIFAINLKKYMNLHKKSRRDVCEALGFNYYTFSDWVNGKKYPRMDKVEMLANYFGILKSDLIEKKAEDEKKNDAIASIVVKLNTNDDFFDLVSTLYHLDNEKIKNLKALL